jgi:hypothetical protein
MRFGSGQGKRGSCPHPPFPKNETDVDFSLFIGDSFPVYGKKFF